MKNLDFKPKCGRGIISLSIRNKNKAFTLVELIIVVTIIAILATIAFLTLGQYPWEARDVKRLSDKNNIEKALEIYKAQKWYYPAFDTYEGKQVFWTGTMEKLNGEITTLPRDPVTKKPYKIDIIENKVGKTKVARVVLDLETKFTNEKSTLTNSTESSNNTELENFKNQLISRITVLEWVNKIGKTTTSLNTFNTKVTEAKNLLNKSWLTKEEIKDKLKELENLENTLVDELQNNMAYYTGEPDRETCDRNSNWRFTVNWNIITDSKTGLSWSKETATWKIFNQAKKYCESLTTWGQQWRLPGIVELTSITNMSCYWPATYSEFNIISGSYLSSNVYWNDSNYIWELRFDIGDTIWTSPNLEKNVICVSKNKSPKIVWQWSDKSSFDPKHNFWKSWASEQSYEFVNGTTKWVNWIVKDKNTGLFWESQNRAWTKTWRQAKQYCSRLNKWWKTWRLPTIQELRWLVDYSKYSSNFNSDYFAIEPSYWSSTTNAQFTGDAWILGLNYGHTYRDDKTYSNYVLCVAN